MPAEIGDHSDAALDESIPYDAQHRAGQHPPNMSVPGATVAHFITSELRKNEYIRKAVFIG